MTDKISPPTAFLIGSRVYLRALTETDADGPYVGWFNDAEVCRENSHHVFPYTRASALDYIRVAAQTRDALILAAVLKDDGRHIGNVALQSIHPIYRTAEFSIVVGDHGAWGRGYGLEAAHLLFRHGFEELNLHRIACGTFAGNKGMQKLALSLGMKEEGRRREAAFKNGGRCDVVEYGLLRSEYEPVPGNQP